MQNKYSKTICAREMASAPKSQVRPNRSKMAVAVRARWYEEDFLSADTNAPLLFSARMARIKITKLMTIIARMGVNWATWKGSPCNTQLLMNNKKRQLSIKALFIFCKKNVVLLDKTRKIAEKTVYVYCWISKVHPSYIMSFTSAEDVPTTNQW